MGGNSILAYFFRPAVTRGETLTRVGFSGGKLYTGDSLCYNTGSVVVDGVVVVIGIQRKASHIQTCIPCDKTFK